MDNNSDNIINNKYNKSNYNILFNYNSNICILENNLFKKTFITDKTN